MKNLLYCFLFCLLFFDVHAYADEAEKITIIKGHYNTKNAKWVKLYKAHEGGKEHYASIRLAADRSFAFMVSGLQKGFYYIADQTENLYCRFYAEQGNTVELEITNNKYQLIRPSIENALLYDWQKDIYAFRSFMLEIEKIAASPRNYLSMLKKLKAKIANDSLKVSSSNSYFNLLFQAARYTDVNIMTLQAASSKDTSVKNDEINPAVLSPGLFSDTTILHTGEALELMSRYVRHKLSLPKNSILPFAASGLFDNGRLKAVYLRHAVDSYTDHRLLVDSLSACTECQAVAIQQEAFKSAVYQKLLSIRKLAKGQPAYPFQYKDAAGRIVSMNDFRGKWVLVDVWATWCVPCKEEIPYLKQLKDELEGTQLEIIGIAADKADYEQRWRKFLTDNKPAGVQLFSGSWEDFTDYYDIATIPRFLIFDPNGNIVTTQAPRPSAPELKKLLLDLMNAVDK